MQNASCLVAQIERRERLTDDLAHDFQRRFLAGEQLELQGGLANKHIDAGQDMAAAVAGLLMAQSVLKRVLSTR